MKFSAVAVALSTLAVEVASRQFDIPWVDTQVKKALEAKPNYKFEGTVAPAAEVKPQTNVHSNVVEVAQDNAYWYETINHQGVAPFAGGGYSVFRNVKSYGAKGE